jgi:hypothetical protein
VSPLEEYQSRISAHREASARLDKLFRRIGNARLGAGIAAVIMAFFVFGEVWISVWWLLFPLGIFASLVVYHARVVEERERARRAIQFYDRGLARLEDRWMGTGETGERFRNPNHLYAEDLDLFGKGSLFELLSTARTRAGEDILAGWLLTPAPKDQVVLRHQAVQELQLRLDLREDLAVLGSTVRSALDPEAAARWGEAPEVGFPPAARYLAPVIAAALIVLFGLYMAGVFTRTPFLAALLLDLAYVFYLGSRTLRVANAVDAPAHDLGLLATLLRRWEVENVASPLLQTLAGRLRTNQGLAASDQIARLGRLVARLDWQRNVFFAPIAIVLLWGPQVAIAIERWRRVAGGHIREWIETAGELEALASLACYRYEHPSDVFPELADTPGGCFHAEALAHPLLRESQAVPNDVRLGGGAGIPRLWIVSGSNMSGKSTLLRTIGINTVLAWAGGPVRAAHLRISPLSLGASIRVTDSLQDNRSRFYAEITRLREIVSLANGSRTVFFLLDELLSGTNSHDREIGAAAIVRALVDRGALGLITTHDLALAQIALALDGRALNVHFADTLIEGQLHFDYRLQPGVVKRSNALDLMRSVGLEV